MKTYLVISQSTGRYTELQMETPFNGAIEIPEGAEIAVSMMRNVRFFKNSLNSMFDDNQWTTSELTNPESFYKLIENSGTIVWTKDDFTQEPIITTYNHLSEFVRDHSTIEYSTDDKQWFPMERDMFFTLDFILNPNLKFKIT